MDRPKAARFAALALGALALCVMAVTTHLARARPAAWGQTWRGALANQQDALDLAASRRPHYTVDDSIWPWTGRTPRFAYVTYATDEAYLCNALLMFTRLRELKVNAHLGLIHPEAWTPAANGTSINLMLDAIQSLDVDLWPRPLLHGFVFSADEVIAPTWYSSNSKLWALSLTAYDRVIILDSDAIVQHSLDHLFLSPLSAIAMPRAYWNPASSELTSMLVLATPSETLWLKAREIVETGGLGAAFDGEVFNTLAKGHFGILPHRRYALLSGVLRWGPERPALYLPPEVLEYDPRAEYESAFVVHSSDWPVPKPWLAEASDLEKHQPECDPRKHGKGKDCTRRDLWLGHYRTFRSNVERICEPLRAAATEELGEEDQA